MQVACPALLSISFAQLEKLWLLEHWSRCLQSLLPSRNGCLQYLLNSRVLQRNPQSSFLYLMQHRFGQKKDLKRRGRLEEVSFHIEGSNSLKSVCKLGWQDCTLCSLKFSCDYVEKNLWLLTSPPCQVWILSYKLEKICLWQLRWKRILSIQIHRLVA